jgi:hypothetical protein
MKSNATFKTPFDKGALEAALAAAPDRVEDADCPYDPNDPNAVDNFWKNAIVSYSHAELKAKLAERGKRGPNKAPLKTPDRKSVV